MDDTISTYLSPYFSIGKRKKQTSQLCVLLWQAIAAHTRQLQRLGRSPAIIWGGFGMPEENIVGIVCGTSEVWVHVMAVLKMLTAAFS